MSKRWDGTLAGYPFRIVRADDVKGYNKTYTRLRPNNASVDEDGSVSSRPDVGRIRQTAWSGGANWWLPLLRSDNNRSYYTSDRLDAWTKPGSLVPINLEALNTVSSWVAAGPTFVMDEDGVAYLIGDTETTTVGKRDVYEWDGVTNGWIVTNDTTISSASGAFKEYGHIHYNTWGWAMDLNFLYKWDKTVAGTSYSYTNANAGLGFQLFVHNDLVIHYNGDKVYSLDLSGTPAETVIADDGFGLDHITNMGTDAAGSPFVVNQPRLAISTSQGIYYVKNVRQGATLTAYIYRVEVDAGGNWTAAPIATLDNELVLDITWHLGSLVIAATPEATKAMDNDPNTNVQTNIYHVSGGNIGLLGSPLGPNPAETVWKFLGSEGAALYIGSNDGVWVYDGVRGGLHKWFSRAALRGAWYTWVKPYDFVGDDTRHFFYSYGGKMVEFQEDTVALDTVTNFGDDLTTYVLESNLFDFRLPTEQKTVTKAYFTSDPITANAQWTLFLAVDEGAYVEVAQHTGASDGFSEVALSPPVSGRRFQYKLVYETKVATEAVELKELVLEAQQGTVLAVWTLVIDGSEFGNVENQVVDPESVRQDFEALAQNGNTVTYVDRFLAYDRDVSATSTVRIDSIQTSKSDPAESMISVSLVEV